MRRLLRLIGIILATLILLVILATVGLNYFLSPGPLKARIERTVYDKTHLVLKINGNIYWRLFPRFSLQVSDVDLQNPPGFSTTKPLLHVIELDVGVKIFPLLRHKFIINHFYLDGLTLNLITTKEGHQNWGIPVSPGPQAKSTQPESAPSSANQNIQVDAVEIRNANIYFDNQKTHQRLTLTQFNLESNNISMRAPFDIHADGNLGIPFGKGKFDLTTNIDYRPENKQLYLSNFKLKTEFTPTDKPISPIMVSLSTKVGLNLNQQQLTVSNINTTINNMQFSGDLEGNKITSAPQFYGKFTATNFNLRSFLASVGTKTPPFKNPSALANASGSVSFVTAPNSIKVNNLRFNLDNSTLYGTASLTNHNFLFNLSLDQLDSNFYAQASQDTTGPRGAEETATPSPSGASAAAPLALLAQYQGQGRITINNLTLGGTKLSDLNINLNANRGTLALNPIQTSIYDGAFNGQLVFSGANNMPGIALSGAFSNIQLQSFLQSTNPVTKLKAQGLAGINISITTRGTTLPAITQNLNGHLLFNVKNGALNDIDLEYYLNLGKAILQHKSLSSVTNTHQTTFGNLSGSFTITQGVATTSDVLLQGPILEAHGKGSADLANQSINMQLQINPAGLDNYSVPIKISGPFSNISIRPDFDTLIKNQIQQQTQKIISSNVNKLIQQNVQNVGNTGKDIVNSLSALIRSQ